MGQTHGHGPLDEKGISHAKASSDGRVPEKLHSKARSEAGGTQAQKHVQTDAAVGGGDAGWGGGSNPLENTG